MNTALLLLPDFALILLGVAIRRWMHLGDHFWNGVEKLVYFILFPALLINVNPQSTLLLGQARGAAISALVHAALPVAEYTALQTKQAVVGHGKAAKEQVQEMIVRLLKLPGAPAADAADALACAICHAHGGQGLGAMATAGYRVRGGRLIG